MKKDKATPFEKEIVTRQSLLDKIDEIAQKRFDATLCDEQAMQKRQEGQQILLHARKWLANVVIKKDGVFVAKLNELNRLLDELGFAWGISVDGASVLEKCNQVYKAVQELAGI